MLEEPECGAPGARAAATAMECRERPAFPGKKLIQARLPFKRLTPTPKEKSQDGPDDRPSQGAPPPPGHLPHLGTFLDTAENDGPLDLLGTQPLPPPKLVNGKGPLDQFLCHPAPAPAPALAPIIIDLTEDSNEPPDGPVARGTQKAEATAPETEGTEGTEAVGMGAGRPECGHQMEAAGPLGPSSDWCDSEDKERSAASSPNGPPEQARGGWSQAGGLLFKDKWPVVVLQDILATKAPPDSPPGVGDPRALDVDLPESGPEEDSVLSHSSLSSFSPTSSPEGPTAATTRTESPLSLPACTPIRKVPKKVPRDSAEKTRLKLQRDQERLGRQQKLQAEKEEKEKQKEQARRAREEARRRREEEKEMKEKERRERRQKDERERAEKQRLKEERKKERQEALEAKQEEKRKKEEERRQREEEKRIKAEKAEITRFFQRPKTPQAPKTLAGSCGKFAPFEIKEHMVLAPQSRAALAPALCEQLDSLLQLQASGASFLDELRTRRPLCSGPTAAPQQRTDIFNSDVIILESSPEKVAPRRRPRGRMKLLQFCENHRPAYWGSWTKHSTVIRPRHPWAQDSKLLDYEVDSDEEWEEEEPGESLSHSEGDEDDELGDDDDDDDGFFVPHGYLSEDEGVTEECGDPEKHKVRQKLKAKEWDELLAHGKGFRVLQPVAVGCVWAGHAGGPHLRLLQQFRACPLEPAPPEEELTPKASKREKRDQQILAQLLPLLHGNVSSSKVIIREFQECCRRGLLCRDAPSPESRTASPPSPSSSRPPTPPVPEDTAVPSKARLKRLISENSVYEKRPDFRMCWYVLPQVLRSFDQEHLPVPCQWSYVTMLPKDDGGAAPSPAAVPSPATPATPATPASAGPTSSKRKSVGSMCITQFMKKRRHDGQVGFEDLDGFQADTEEEDDDGDCVMEVPVAADLMAASSLASEAGDPAPAAPR
ncbi:chromatin assembly factor 1 subunit A isoform X1 [Erinaceus europaeus]|uniref:Chromatin assembly factor 1 subunit A isoform X1 n=1 Tax=Erinaceus europaeus TaxID=9365 RepID=A0ABM3WMY5_ERIEU|nr:chromatin assembly factor 1 subunit A isoform X1 [Erinaceus europaeus]